MTPLPAVYERRCEVARLRREGMRLSSIARRMGVSMGTIDNDLRAIRKARAFQDWQGCRS